MVETTAMSSPRMDILRSILAQNPADSFSRYGLAMEYVKAGDPEEAVRQFRELIAVNANYAAAYFHAGQALEKLGRAGEARDMYRDGIAVTTRSGDDHTRSELQAALD